MKGDVKTVLDCPLCLTTGQILNEKRRLLVCKCPKCGFEWHTIKVGKVDEGSLE